MRQNIVALVVATVWLASVPLTVAQKAPTVRRIGFLTMASMPSSSSFYEVFRQGLRELGYIEGQNIIIEYRSAESSAQLVELATDLVRLPVEVIVTPGRTTAPARMATGTVPIVFSYSVTRLRRALSTASRSQEET